MPYGRGQQNDRRRRVLTDLLLGSEAPQTRPGRRGSKRRGGLIGKSENYGDAEFLDEQPRLTDLIPLRLRFFAILLVIGLATIAGLEQFYAWRPRILPWTPSGRVAALDLAGGGTLAGWFSSMVLALAGLTAILVFTVRRHKRDDYHGHYRVWLWAAACWFLMSLDAVVGLRHTLGEILISLSGSRLWGDGSVWWLIPYGFVVGGIGTRLVVDMRRCYLSTTTLLVAAGCYLGAISARLGGITVGDATRQVMLLHGAVLAGNFFVLLSMGLHGRYVLFDARGLLPRQEEEVEDADEELACEEDDEGAEISASSGGGLRIRPPQSVPASLIASSGPVSPLLAPAPKPAPFPPANNGFAPAPVNRKLTKQEKKALRERLLRAQQQRRQAG